MTGSPGGPEGVLLRRTVRRLALQTAGLIAAALLVVSALAAGLIIRTQQVDAQRSLTQALGDEDVASDPPSGILVYEEPHGRGPAQLAAPLDPAALDQVRRGAPSRSSAAHRDGRHYLVRTGRRGRTVVQVGLDMTELNQGRARLLEGLGMAAAAGLVLAAVLGWLIAYRAMRPIGQAIVRQQRFIADASHELRTPLTQVHTRAQLLRRGLRRIDGEAQLQDDAERLVRGTRLLGEIVDELLTSAQLRADPGYRERVDLLAVAEDVVQAEVDRADAGQVTMTVIPEPGPHDVGGSATALRRVVNSLVDNALGHTPADGHVEVRLVHTRHPETVVLTVADDGVGLSDVDERRLFERFARGTQGSGRRYGLGLALVREVVESHGGTVSAAGRPGHGAIFTVRLPAWVDPPISAADADAPPVPS